MPLEIERKFLVVGDGWRGSWPVTPIRQGYLSVEPGRVVRVRVAGDQGYLTIKGRSGGPGLRVRTEYEYPIPRPEAEELLAHCLQPVIEKRRHRLSHRGAEWVVDVFEGANAGLVMAEIELERADQPIELPDWAGAEVTADPRYHNSSLAQHPFREWGGKS
jgi:adenylate cyclase